MKSGSKIYASMHHGCGDPERIAALSNGNLRSLITYIHGTAQHRTETGGIILGLCMVEATERFMKKGKGKGL